MSVYSAAIHTRLIHIHFSSTIFIGSAKENYVSNISTYSVGAASGYSSNFLTSDIILQTFHFPFDIKNKVYSKASNDFSHCLIVITSYPRYSLEYYTFWNVGYYTILNTSLLSMSLR